jgi:photosystem II stability/assembly factor-like uncharacterized protein
MKRCFLRFSCCFCQLALWARSLSLIPFICLVGFVFWLCLAQMPVAHAQSWTAVNNGLFPPSATGTVQNVAANGTTIFASTVDNAWVYRLMRSANNGDTWSAVAVPGASTSDRFGSFYFNGSTVFAAQTGGFVFRSLNDGVSWQAVSYLPAMPNARSSGSTLRAGTSLDGNGSTVFIASGGVFRSLNNGTSWQRIQQGLPLTNPSDPTTLAFTAQDIAVSGTTVFLCASQMVFSDNSLIGSLWRSLDNGDSWSRMSLPTGVQVYSVAANGAFVVLVDYQGRVYRSTNNGASFQQVYQFGSVVRSTLFYAQGTLFAGTDQGVAYSSDNGATWLGIASSGQWLDNRVYGVTANASHLFIGTDFNASVPELIGCARTATSTIPRTECVLQHQRHDNGCDRCYGVVVWATRCHHHHQYAWAISVPASL